MTSAGVELMPMSQVLDLALGTPEDGCVNLVLLHAAIRRLVVFVGAESQLVNVKGGDG